MDKGPRTPWMREETECLRTCMGTQRKSKGCNIWNEISRMMHMREYNRSAAQCYQHWTRTANPEIKHTEWTSEEDKILMQSIDKTELKGWKRVALRLSRSDVQCRNRYNHIISHPPRKQAAQKESPQFPSVLPSVASYLQYKDAMLPMTYPPYVRDITTPKFV